MKCPRAGCGLNMAPPEPRYIAQKDGTVTLIIGSLMIDGITRTQRVCPRGHVERIVAKVPA